MRTVWGLVFFCSAVLLIRFCREQYETWMKICGYLMFLAFLSETAVWGTDLAAVADVYLSDLCFMPIIALQYSGGESSAVSQKIQKTGEERKAFMAVTIAVQALLIAAVLVLMGKTGRAGASPYLYAFGTGAHYCTNTYSLLIRKDGDLNLRGVKAAAVCIGRTALYGVPVFVNDVDGHCDCVLLYRVAGFLAEMRMKRKYKALAGLRTGSGAAVRCKTGARGHPLRQCCSGRRDFLSEASFCFGISLVYNLVDKWMGRRENAKN